MSVFLGCYLRNYSTKVSPKFPSIYTLHKYALPRRQNSSISFQKSRLKYGAVLTKPQLQKNCSKKPLVVILGWNDCKLKHLEKYSSLFEEGEWSTICLPTKSFNTFFRSGTVVKKIGIYMAEVIKDHTQKNQPVFLYAFSNGGCAVYFQLTETLTSSANPHHNSVNVVGSILDSCPVKPTVESVQRAQISMTEQIRNPVVRSLIWYPVGIMIRLLLKIDTTLQRFFNDLGKMPLNSPQLFLFSKADRLAIPEDIREHIAVRQAQGVKVFSKCWEDSPHVQHYLKYPVEYAKLLQEFTTACLKKDKYD